MQEDHQHYNTVYDRVYDLRPRARAQTLSCQPHYDSNPNPYYSSHVPSCGQDRREYYRHKAKLASARVHAVRSFEYGTSGDLELNRPNDFRQRTTSFSSYFQRKGKQSSRMEDTEQFWNKYRRLPTHKSSAFGAKLRQFLFFL